LASDKGWHTDDMRKAVKELKRELSLPTPAEGLQPRLYVGRAENMDFLTAESVDIIVTSPPYNLGADDWPMGGNDNMASGLEGRTSRDGIGYNDVLPEQDYQDWQVDCLAEWFRVAKWGGSLFYNHKVRQRKGEIVHPMDWLRKTEWTIRQEIIWDRGSTHNHASTLFWPYDERIYWMTKGKPILPDRSIGVPSVWRFHGPVANTWHPAPFSEELPRTCLEAIARAGVMVLDPFGGSMTVCKVASEMGLESIGVDISKEYVEEAKRVNGWMK